MYFCISINYNMELFVLILLLSIATADEQEVENDCLSCIKRDRHTFYKVVWSTSAPAEYVCRSSGTLISKFGYVVDSACDEMDCANITTRLHLRHSRRYGYFDCRLQETVETSNHHSKIIHIIRDYLEILLMSIVCGILVLKKKLLIQCIKSHWKEEGT
jgi:hypothetical protein